jgi:hypothetical protein
MRIKALTFDTGGTVLDWHGGLVQALSRAGAAHGIRLDWHEVANHWRHLAMKAIVGQVRPSFNMDDVHRTTLDETLAHFAIGSLDADEVHDIWHAWHRLDAWPDFPGALNGLRAMLPVVSSERAGLGRGDLLRDAGRLQAEPGVLCDDRAVAVAGASADPHGGLPQLRPQRGEEGRFPHRVHPPT